MASNLVSRNPAEPRVTLKCSDVNVAQQTRRLHAANQGFESLSVYRFAMPVLASKLLACKCGPLFPCGRTLCGIVQNGCGAFILTVAARVVLLPFRVVR